jgi:hypothetical protein
VHKMTAPDTKRFPLSLRTTKQLREKLEAASAESGRSLAQEIELRLELSFDREASIAETLKHFKLPPRVPMRLPAASRDRKKKNAG